MNHFVMIEPLQPPCQSYPYVLAVEDDQDNMLLLSYIVGKLKYKLLKAEDGVTALSLATTYLPHLIILDFILPQLNGFQVMEKLRQNKLTQRIPVIAVTGLVSAEDQVMIRQSGCIDYVCKPYLLEELESKILFYVQSSKSFFG